MVTAMSGTQLPSRPPIPRKEMVRPARKSAAKKPPPCAQHVQPESTPRPTVRFEAIDSGFLKHLQEAGCRKVELDEAMAVAKTFLESILIDNVNLTENAAVFRALCLRELILEKQRAELITRALCPISLHSLCIVFATSFCSVVMRTQL